MKGNRRAGSRVRAINLAVRASCQPWQTFAIVLHLRQDVGLFRLRRMRTSWGHQCVPFESTCVCFSRLFVGKTWPRFLTSKPPCALSLFFFPPSLIMFCLLPSKQPDSLSFPPPAQLFLLFRRPALTWLQHASLHPTAVFIIPAFAWIPLRESSLCLERRKKTVMSRTPPASGPDGSQRFRMEQRDATHSKFRGCSVA